ncbi:hypothetical protein [Pedobacter sp. NJ-S-72]
MIKTAYMRILINSVLFFVALVPLIAEKGFAQSKNIIVKANFGTNYLVSLPDKWVVDSTDSDSKKRDDDCWIYKSKEDLNADGILIQLRSFKRNQNHLPLDDLNADVNEYLKETRDSIQVFEWNNLPLKYKYASKGVFKVNSFYQYLCYVHFDKENYPLQALSVAVNKGKNTLNTDEQKIISSFIESVLLVK